MKSNIVRSGRGPQLVLIHGLGGNLHSWDEITDILQKQFSILRYDLRGHGQSHNPPGPWIIDDFLDDLEAVLAKNLDESFFLAGFSLGGLVSQGFTLRNPAAVRKLAIISAVAGRTEPERQKVLERVANLERGDLDTNIELALERWFSPEFRKNNPDRVQKRLDILKSNDPGGYLNAYRVFGLGDLAHRLNDISCPTLVMTGEHDPGSNVRMARLMHEKIPGSKLEILPNLRHSVLVEAPTLIARNLENFFLSEP